MKADYGWIILLAIAVLIVLFWRPISGMFTSISDKASNKEQVDRGKIVFYDVEQWGGPGSYKSCSMCHAADFEPDPSRKIEMGDYTGEVYVLKGIRTRYRTSALDTGDELYQRVMKCVTNPSRLGCSQISIRAKYIQDLLVYVGRL